MGRSPRKKAKLFASPSTPLGTLAKLPVEMRQMIYSFALAEDKPIMPVQVAPRSNKFFSNPAEHGMEGKRRPKPLTVTTLRKVCRSIHADVDGLGLFYEVNTFKFETLHTLAVYVAAIRPRSRAKILHIQLQASVSRMWTMVPHMVHSWGYYIERGDGYLWKYVQQECRGLRRLSLLWQAVVSGPDYLTADDSAKNSDMTVRRLRSLCQYMPPGIRDFRGLDFFRVGLSLHHPHLRYGLDEYEPHLQLHLTGNGCPELDKLVIARGSNVPVDADRLFEAAAPLRAMVQAMCQPPDDKYIPLRFASDRDRVTKWMTKNLDVWGEGRGTDDRQPGVVASRTRGQLRRSLREDGLVTRQRPKFSLDGYLTWYPVSVLDGRVRENTVDYEFDFKIRFLEEKNPSWVPFEALLVPGTSWSKALDDIEGLYRVVLRSQAESTKQADNPTQPAYSRQCEHIRVDQLPHPADIVEAIKLGPTCYSLYIRMFSSTASAWGERSPRIEVWA